MPMIVQFTYREIIADWQLPIANFLRPNLIYRQLETNRQLAIENWQSF